MRMLQSKSKIASKSVITCRLLTKNDKLDAFEPANLGGVTQYFGQLTSDQATSEVQLSKDALADASTKDAKAKAELEIKAANDKAKAAESAAATESDPKKKAADIAEATAAKAIAQTAKAQAEAIEKKNEAEKV